MNITIVNHQHHETLTWGAMVTKYSCTGLDMWGVCSVQGRGVRSYNGLLTVLQNLFRSIQAEDWVEMLETSQQLTFLQLTGGCIKRRFKKQISIYVSICMYEDKIYKDNFISSMSGIREIWWKTDLKQKMDKNNWLQIFTFQSEDWKDMESLRKYALTSLICIATCSIPPQQQEPVKLHHD